VLHFCHGRVLRPATGPKHAMEGTKWDDDGVRRVSNHWESSNIWLNYQPHCMVFIVATSELTLMPIDVRNCLKKQKIV